MTEEIRVRKKQEEMYGPIDRPMTGNEVRIKIRASREVMDKDFIAFNKSPCTRNFKNLKFSMYWYQYWMKKAIYEEVEC
jgi:hypothetical protein